MSTIYTIKTLFGHQNLREVLYVVRSPKLAVYVGMANVQCVSNRMARHINDVFNKENPSRFSSLLFQSHPLYFDWEVEVLSKSDAEATTNNSYDCLPCAERGLYDFLSLQQDAAPEGNAIRPRNRCLMQPNPSIKRDA